MAKPLMVEYQGQPLNLNLTKIDRTKLYGYVDTEVVDEAGRFCELGTLLSDGHTLAGKGGTGLGYLSQDGLWRKKAELRPVDKNGAPIVPVKSTFDTIVKLDQKVSIDDYLSHNIKLIYQLTTDAVGTEHGHLPQVALAAKCPALMAELRAGAIFAFPFSYRGGVSSSAGFMLLGSDGNLFMCVGVPTDLDYVGLKATAAVVVDEAEAEEEEELSFDLV